MKVGTPKYERIAPEKAPTPAATARTITTARIIGSPALTTNTPTSDDDSAAIEPTEMSISPATITRVIANATIPKKAAFCRMLSWLPGVRKSGVRIDSVT